MARGHTRRSDRGDVLQNVHGVPVSFDGVPASSGARGVVCASIGQGALRGSAERADAEDLMDVPFDEIEGTVTRRGEGIAAGDSLGFRSRACSDEIDAQAAIRRRTGKHDVAREVLLSHPAQVFIEADVPCLARL
jgi:hypothetical protein